MPAAARIKTFRLMDHDSLAASRLTLEGGRLFIILQHHVNGAALSWARYSDERAELTRWAKEGPNLPDSEVGAMLKRTRLVEQMTYSDIHLLLVSAHQVGVHLRLLKGSRRDGGKDLSELWKRKAAAF
jgi:hypothetical protein